MKSQNFSDFAKVIDEQPARAVLGVARMYARTIERDKKPDQPVADPEAQRIMKFCHFLDTLEVPADLTGAEKDFYRRTAEKLVAAGTMSAKVLNLLK
jgi:hypothetical protein